MSPLRRRRPALLLATLAAGLLLLGACGKKGDLRPPPGEYQSFTWPQQYPAPATVVPTPPAEAAQEQEDRLGEPAVTRGFRPAGALPQRDPTRRTTTTYSSQ